MTMTIQKRYCVNGTVGHKILNGQKRLEFEKGQVTEVKMSVQYMSFSAHADAKVRFFVVKYEFTLGLTGTCSLGCCLSQMCPQITLSFNVNISIKFNTIYARNCFGIERANV